MAFSDLCHISNAFKSVENETDQSERIMEENSMVRDLITKILDETGPSDSTSSIQPSEKTLSSISTNSINYKNDAGNTAFAPRACNYNNMYNFTQSEPNGFSYNPNGFTSNGFVNFPDNDVNSLLGFDTVDTTDSVSPEQLNLLRLAAQEIGGAQFQNPTKFDYNFFEPNQRNSLPEANLFPANYNRPNSLNVDMNFNANFDNQNFNSQRYPNKFEGSFMKDQNDSTEILAYLNQLNISLDRSREDNGHNMDFKMPEMNGHFQNEDFNRTQEDRNKMFYNRNFNQPPKSFNGDSNFYLNDMIPPMNERNQMPNFDFNQSQPNMNYKPNGFQNDFRREMGQYNRDFQGNGIERNFDNQMNRENMQQALLRQNELARQMSILMRNRPPPNQLNVDVNFLHENTPYNLGLGALLGPSPSVLPSPMLDIPLLAPFHAMRNMRSAATSSGILHARLDACYEQWRQLERERKRTEARLALAYPGRAVSSSNSIPVPRLPPCPTRVDRLTVDMLREHTKVLTLMGKMETLRASVCVAQNKKPNKTEDCRITVLKRGQEDLPNDAERGDGDPESFDPASWKDDVKNLAEIAPHSEVESAMLAWRSAVAGVQAARRRELARHSHTHDPILQLADAVKQLAACARRARCAMWCDLTLTVALAPGKQLDSPQTNTAKSRETASPNQNKAQGNAKPTTSENKEEKPATETAPVVPKPEANNNANKPANKQTDKQDKNQQRRTQNYRNKLNQSRNDFYKNNQRYDNRFMHNRHPYHYLATGPIN